MRISASICDCLLADQNQQQPFPHPIPVSILFAITKKLNRSLDEGHRLSSTNVLSLKIMI